MADVEHLSAVVVDAALKLRRDLGPGLLETVYENVLAAWLERDGLSVLQQQPISFTYEELQFDAAFRIDLIVENQLLVEIKSVERLNAVHAKQLLTYLRLTRRPLGF